MRKSKKILIVFACFIVICAALLALVYFKLLHPNDMFIGSYKVRGVDVSSYQGEIDWKELSTKGIDFAFIKATEGSGQVDEKFEYNFKNAADTKLYYGAYHFFSYDSSGKEQAEHFIKTVEKKTGMLAPVIDLEFYGKYEDDPKDSSDVVPEVSDMAKALEEHYGIKPIIYATGKSYDKYIKGSKLEDYPLWIRNVYFKPLFAGDWVFWQYSDDAKLEGYKGEEEHIDMDAFFGDKEKLKDYTVK